MMKRKMQNSTGSKLVHGGDTCYWICDHQTLKQNILIITENTCCLASIENLNRKDSLQKVYAQRMSTYEVS